MADNTLRAEAALNGFSHRIGNTVVREVTDLDIVSIATPIDGHSALNHVLMNKLGLTLPAVGTVQRDGVAIALMGLQSDQCFLVSRSSQVDPVVSVRSTIGDTAYLTDQSDSWVIVELQGSEALRALERICSIDLAPDKFDAGCVARTSMEHLSVIIERPAPDLFRLYSPRSSASSFLHAVTLSLQNACSYTAV